MRTGPKAEKTVNAVKETVSKTMGSSAMTGQFGHGARVRSASLADALIEASHDADMVVVEERGGFARWLARPVGAQVTRHAACPVVVISGQR